MAPQHISACRGRTSALLVLRIKDRMCLESRTSRLRCTRPSCGTPDPWSLARWFVRPSVPTNASHAHHRHEEIRGKSKLDTTWSGSGTSDEDAITIKQFLSYTDRDANMSISSRQHSVPAVSVNLRS